MRLLLLPFIALLTACAAPAPSDGLSEIEDIVWTSRQVYDVAGRNVAIGIARDRSFAMVEADGLSVDTIETVVSSITGCPATGSKSWPDLDAVRVDTAC